MSYELLVITYLHSQNNYNFITHNSVTYNLLIELKRYHSYIDIVAEMMRNGYSLQSVLENADRISFYMQKQILEAQDS